MINVNVGEDIIFQQNKRKPERADDVRQYGTG